MTPRATPTARQWAAVPAVYAGLGGLVFGALHGGERALGPALAVALGPLAGGFVRDWQSCCAEFSMGLAAPVLAMAAPGLVVAFLVEPTTRARRVLRWTLWLATWVVWFFSALVSYLHALE